MGIPCFCLIIPLSGGAEIKPYFALFGSSAICTNSLFLCFHSALLVPLTASGLASLVSAFVGGALAREMVATEVKEEDGGVGEDEGEGGGVVGFVDGVEGLVGCRELKESGQQKRSWK